MIVLAVVAAETFHKILLPQSTIAIELHIKIFLIKMVPGGVLVDWVCSGTKKYTEKILVDNFARVL